MNQRFVGALQTIDVSADVDRADPPRLAFAESIRSVEISIELGQGRLPQWSIGLIVVASHGRR